VRYLKVTIETPYDTLVRYTPLDDDKEYSGTDLIQIGQDTVNEVCSWGIGETLLDESEVPEEERVG
jgi:hypothetical protein